MPEASIIIRTFNEEKYLLALLEGIDRQNYRDFETVVVDSGSFDLTTEIAEEHADFLVRIKSSDFTFGHSLNVGIRESSGRYLVIVSAHTLPVDAFWLERLIAPLEDPRVGMVYGRQRGVQESKFSECMDFERIFREESRVLEPPSFFANNANSAVRRSLWEQHSFDETLPGLEDIEWAKFWMESGYQVVYRADAGIYHIHDETWEQVQRRYYREGQAARWIGVRGRRDIPREIWHEIRCAAVDLGLALLRGRVRRLIEIVRFRYAKLRGTVGGIWDGSITENPLERKKLLFDRPYRAVVIHGPGHASLDSIDVPSLKPSEVLVRVAYQGICATDIEILDGKLGYYKDGLAEYPIVPGHEFSGVVADVGARVTDFQHGDRVVVECIQGCGECAACARENTIGCAKRREVGVIGSDGGYAEYMISQVRFLHRIPEAISLKQACLCEPVAVVIKGLRRLESSWGTHSLTRSCAVVGAGPIGHLAARILSERGHQVTVFDRSQTRLAALEGSGIEVSETLDRLDTFDALIEATGDPDIPLRLLDDSTAGASLLLLGLPYGRRELDLETVVGFDKSLVGSVGSTREDFQRALKTISTIDTSMFMKRSFPLSQFREAWEVARRGEYVKVILEVGGTCGIEARLSQSEKAGDSKGLQDHWLPVP
jgi:2-desacetyl-2-hydroxyethyl bacteriochlorophyllide A dehydrogenase